MLRAGFSSEEITPDEPHMLVGISQGRAPTGTLDPLRVKAVAFEGRDGTKALLLVFDLLYVGTRLSERIYAECTAVFGMDRDKVLILATHTHSGPKSAEDFEDGNPVDNALCDRLFQQAIAAVRGAVSDLAPARIEGIEVSGCPTVNRRVPVPALARLHPRMRHVGCLNRPNRKVHSDTQISAFKLLSPDGACLWIVNAAVHSSIHRGDAYSADFPAYLESALRASTENAGQSCSGVVYLQGWAGDQVADLTVPLRPGLRPGALFDYLVSSEIFDRSTAVEGLVRIGGAIAERIARASPRDLGSDDQIDAAAPEASLSTELGEQRRVRVKYLAIGPMRFLAVAGEPFASYRTAVKQADEILMTVGYLDGPVGYLPDRNALPLGGYETDRSITYFGQKGRFTPAAADALLDVLLNARRAG